MERENEFVCAHVRDRIDYVWCLISIHLCRFSICCVSNLQFCSYVFEMRNHLWIEMKMHLQPEPSMKNRFERWTMGFDVSRAHWHNDCHIHMNRVNYMGWYGRNCRQNRNEIRMTMWRRGCETKKCETNEKQFIRISNLHHVVPNNRITPANQKCWWFIYSRRTTNETRAKKTKIEQAYNREWEWMSKRMNRTKWTNKKQSIGKVLSDAIATPYTVTVVVCAV